MNHKTSARPSSTTMRYFDTSLCIFGTSYQCAPATPAACIFVNNLRSIESFVACLIRDSYARDPYASSYERGGAR